MCSFGHALFGEVLIRDQLVSRHVWWGLLFSTHAVHCFIRMRGWTSSSFGASNSQKLPCLNVDMGITAPHQTGCQRLWLCSMYERSWSLTIWQISSRLYKGYVWHAKLFMDPTDQVPQWDQLVDPTSDFIIYPPDGTEWHHQLISAAMNRMTHTLLNHFVTLNNALPVFESFSSYFINSSALTAPFVPPANWEQPPATWTLIPGLPTSVEPLPSAQNHSSFPNPLPVHTPSQDELAVQRFEAIGLSMWSFHLLDTNLISYSIRQLQRATMCDGGSKLGCDVLADVANGLEFDQHWEPSVWIILDI